MKKLTENSNHTDFLKQSSSFQLKEANYSLNNEERIPEDEEDLQIIRIESKKATPLIRETKTTSKQSEVEVQLIKSRALINENIKKSDQTGSNFEISAATQLANSKKIVYKDKKDIRKQRKLNTLFRCLTLYKHFSVSCFLGPDFLPSDSFFKSRNCAAKLTKLHYKTPKNQRDLARRKCINFSMLCLAMTGLPAASIALYVPIGLYFSSIKECAFGLFYEGGAKLIIITVHQCMIASTTERNPQFFNYVSEEESTKANNLELIETNLNEASAQIQQMQHLESIYRE